MDLLEEKRWYMGNAKGVRERTMGDRTCDDQQAKSRNRQQDEEGRLGVFRENQLVELLQHVAIERDASCAEEAGPKNKPSRGLRD